MLAPRAFVLFLLLFLQGSSTSQAAVTADTLRRNQFTRDVLFKNFKAATTQYSFEYVVVVVPAGTLPGIKVPVPVSHIRYSDTVFFDFDRYSLKPAAENIVAELAKTILKDTSARSILIVGHTDSIGTDDYNSSLSLKRAVAVASKLREAGINDEILGVVPMGEAQPLQSNSTPQGQALNRRVEFFISEVPEAPQKAIELIKFNPCNRNDHVSAANSKTTDCAQGDVRIPVLTASGERERAKLNLARQALPTGSIPPVRANLPKEILQRPSIKELQSP